MLCMDLIMSSVPVALIFNVHFMTMDYTGFWKVRWIKISKKYIFPNKKLPISDTYFFIGYLVKEVCIIWEPRRKEGDFLHSIT